MRRTKRAEGFWQKGTGSSRGTGLDTELGLLDEAIPQKPKQRCLVFAFNVAELTSLATLGSQMEEGGALNRS